MSTPGESESKLDVIIRKFIEKYDTLGKTDNKTSQNGVAEIYQILQESRLFSQLVAKESKSDQGSEKLRAVGNTAYKARDFEVALQTYTRAVCSAEVESEAMALAHANRSAVHYEIQEHNDVIKDIHHALANGKYPEHMKHKLLERRAKSYLALSQFQKALEDLKKVVYYTANSDLNKRQTTASPINSNPDQEKITDLINRNLEISHITNGELDQDKIISHLLHGKMDRDKVQRLKSLLDLIAKCIGQPNLPQRKSANPKISHKPSTNTKSAFPALEIAVSPEMGKHVVAATNISPGDILAVEKPHVSVLTPEFNHVFCNNCKAKCYSSMPCKNCNNVVFCSEDCRQKGWESHHSIECDLLPTVIDLGCKVNILIGIRGLLKATRCGKDLERFVEDHVNQSKTTSRKSKGNKCSQTKIHQSNDFHSVHNLVTHEEDRSEVQMLGVMVSVSCIVHILKNGTRFFGSPSTHVKSLGLHEVVTANLISRYFMMAGCNAFEIGESTCTDCGDFTDYQFKIIGGALYPTLCLLNHSCDPDVTAYMSDEETRILYAIKPIRKGDQIFISYGPEYTHHDLSTRQKELKSKYFFTCECSACLNNWPLANNLPEYPKFISHKLESAQGPRIFETCNKLPEIVLAAEKGMITQEQFQAVVQYLSLYHKYVIRPWKYYFAAQRVIRQYFNNKGKHIGEMSQALM